MTVNNALERLWPNVSHCSGICLKESGWLVSGPRDTISNTSYTSDNGQCPTQLSYDELAVVTNPSRTIETHLTEMKCVELVKGERQQE
jgi:hypothetical protein